MLDSYRLQLQVGDRFVSHPCASHDEAVQEVYEKLLERYPDQPDLYGLPEPITENDLRTVIEDLDLKATFSISTA